MNRYQIDQLLQHRAFPEACQSAELVETHISWVLLTGQFAYKIKKPVRYSFLDFSTLKQRAYYTRREVLLNSRLSKGIYLDRVPVRMRGETPYIGPGEDPVIDYAVKMRRLDASLQMDRMLQNHKVKTGQIDSLAKVLADFHRHTRILKSKNQALLLQTAFNDVALLDEELNLHLAPAQRAIIYKAIAFSNEFLHRYRKLLDLRVQQGYLRDCHGDLHAGNIFLYARPIVFDCIEFSDELRAIDLLNELAFLCMDLEYWGEPEMAARLLEAYQGQFQVIRNEEEKRLFVYFKLYRANVRAKIALLRSQQEVFPEPFIERTAGHLNLMQQYLHQLQTNSLSLSLHP